MANKIAGLKYPAADKLNSRISTLRRSMANTLLPRKGTDSETEERWRKYFSGEKCAYCGKIATHLDHLFPLIEDKRPTGYYTEPANLVPCCSKCNQKKGPKNWEVFMNEFTDSDKDKRISTIKSFQKEMPANKIVLSNDDLESWDRVETELSDTLAKAKEKLENLKRNITDKQ